MSARTGRDGLLISAPALAAELAGNPVPVLLDARWRLAGPARHRQLPAGPPARRGLRRPGPGPGRPARAARARRPAPAAGPGRLPGRDARGRGEPGPAGRGVRRRGRHGGRPRLVDAALLRPPGRPGARRRLPGLDRGRPSGDRGRAGPGTRRLHRGARPPAGARRGRRAGDGAGRPAPRRAGGGALPRRDRAGRPRGRAHPRRGQRAHRRQREPRRHLPRPRPSSPPGSPPSAPSRRRAPRSAPTAAPVSPPRTRSSPWPWPASPPPSTSAPGPTGSPTPPAPSPPAPKHVPSALQVSLKFSGRDVVPSLFGRTPRPLNRDGTQGAGGGIQAVPAGRRDVLHDPQRPFRGLPDTPRLRAGPGGEARTAPRPPPRTGY